MDKILEILTKLKNLIRDRGILLPFIQDNGKPSVSLTLLMTSFLIWILGATEIIKDMDLDKCENLFMICYAGYFGRKLTKDDKNKKIDLTESINPTQGDKPSAST